MKVRSKMRCTHITNFEKLQEVNLQCIYTPGVDDDFAQATPSGSLKIMISIGKPAYGIFQPGKMYNIDFTEHNDPS